MIRYLSACLFVKDENPYLHEWLAFHQEVGVEHFYVYDNGSRIHVWEFLEDEIERGLVTVVDFPDVNGHIYAYSHCLSTFGYESKWVAFIDADEFLFPLKAWSLKEVLPGYEKYGGVVANWVCFGSSGHLTKPPGLQISNFTMSVPKDHPISRHHKSIVQPEFVMECPTTHYFHTKPGYPTVRTDGRTVEGAHSDPGGDILRINHYWTRSREEFLEKIARGRSDGTTLLNIHNLAGMDVVCTIKDTEILKYASRMEKIAT